MSAKFLLTKHNVPCCRSYDPYSLPYSKTLTRQAAIRGLNISYNAQCLCSQVAWTPILFHTPRYWLGRKPYVGYFFHTMHYVSVPGRMDPYSLPYAKTLTRQEANKLKMNGVNMFTIGVGPRVDHSELIGMASGERNYLRVDSVDQLNVRGLLDNVIGKLCKGMYYLWPLIGLYGCWKIISKTPMCLLWIVLLLWWVQIIVLWKCYPQSSNIHQCKECCGIKNVLRFHVV